MLLYRLKAGTSLQLVIRPAILCITCPYYNLVGGNDYNPGPYNVSFPAGAINVSFNVTINNDAIAENNETFHLIIKDPLLDNVTLGKINQTVVTIVDDGDFGKYVCC